MIPPVGTRLDTPTSPPCRDCGSTVWGKRTRGRCWRCYYRTWARLNRWALCATCAAPIHHQAERCERCALRHRRAA